VVIGLTFATLLTLFLTPVALAAPKTLAEGLGRLRDRFGWARRRPKDRGAGRAPIPPRPTPIAAE